MRIPWFMSLVALAHCNDIPPERPAGPPATAGHAIAVDGRGELIYHGGTAMEESGSYSRGTTWAFDGEFRRIGGAASMQRYAHKMAFDTERRQVVLYGGKGACAPARFCGDLLRWEGDGWREVEVEHAPGPRFGHAVAYDSRRNRLVVFGGVGGGADCSTGDCQATWSFRNDGWEKLE